MHQFCPVVAKEFGVNIAIFLQNLAFWTQKNLANEKHIYDGYCWTYNTLKAFQKIFPYFSKQNLETIIKSCLREGLIIKGNYNKTKYDRTGWYALTPKAYKFFTQLNDLEYINLLGDFFKPISYFQEIDLTESRNGNIETKKPIPDNKPDNKTDSISESDDSPPTDEITNKEFVEVFIEECPYSPHPRNPDNPSKDAIRSFNALRKTWRTEISKSKKALTKESFRGLLQDMKENKSWLVNPDKKVHIDLLCQPKWVIKFLEERAAKGQS